MPWTSAEQLAYRRHEPLQRQVRPKHPNLYMSLRLGGGLPRNRPLDDDGHLKPEWLNLFKEFPERFVIGSDSFHVGGYVRGNAPRVMFSQGNERKAQAARALLSQLPAELAQMIGEANAARLYRFVE